MRIGAATAAIVLALCGYLGYRVVVLEGQVAALTKQLGPPPAGGKTKLPGTEPAHAGDHEQRLALLERQLQGLRNDLQSLEEATGGLPSEAIDPITGEQQILSIVERKANRVRDRQLEFHSSRWLQWREAALDNFSERFGLSPTQNERLHDLLAQEVETMVEILKRPDALENPEQAVSDWNAMLEETDRAAHRLLEPAQVPAWDQARFVERRVLWPWLPEKEE